MFEITEQKLGDIIHELLRIASILKAIEDGGLSIGQKQIIHGCETRLMEIRQEILQSVEENNSKT